MSTAADPILATLHATRPPLRLASSAVLADCWTLTKPEVNFLIVITTFAGFYLGYPGTQGFPFLRMVNTLLGTLLVASGTGTLNQYIERRFDAEMRRTARRPLAAGRLDPKAVLCFGIALSVIGGVYLALAVNLLASALAVATLLSYLFVYTPLKRKTALCTFVGALPGAMPPLIGWAAASGALNLQAWALYVILFLWQFPHFMAIAWMYREDYARAGFLVLPLQGEARTGAVILQTLFPLLLLLPFCLVPFFAREWGIFYIITTYLLSAGYFYCGARFVLRRTNAHARKLLMASIVYLPSVYAVLVFARGA